MEPISGQSAAHDSVTVCFVTVSLSETLTTARLVPSKPGTLRL